jgi:hypothetical protein
MAQPTPLQLAIEYSTESGAEDEIDKLINMANDHKIPATSPVWTEFVSDKKTLDGMQTSIQALELALSRSLEEIQEMKVAALTADNNQNLLPEPTSKKSQPVKKPVFIIPVGLQFAVGFLTGALALGVFSIIFFIPNQVSSQTALQRTKDKEILAYLNTNEGVAFRKMLSKNGAYFPHQCEAEAKRQKLSILVNNKKTTRLCVLALPD